MKEYLGKRFGRLVAVKRILGGRWECICDCGKHHSVSTGHLTSGRVQSCGCYKNECVSRRSKTHGLSNTKIHWIWSAMLDRCYNKNSHAYDRYGGRGITVCESWRGRDGLLQFISDMGLPQDGLSLDRINNDGPYSKSNCRWATAAQQARNTRSAKIVTYNGSAEHLADLCEKSGVDYNTAYSRIWRGWTVEDAVNTPDGSRPRNSVLIEYRGETKSIGEWCKLLGIPYRTVYYRIAAGWTPVDAIETPKCKSRFDRKKKTIGTSQSSQSLS